MEYESMETEYFNGSGDPGMKTNAEDYKNNGNELYKKQKYKEALEMYSEAIRLLPSCAAYYGNRSATYMMLNKYKDALQDAQQATQIDKEFTKGYQREAKCFLALGNALAAMQSYDKALILEPDNKMLLTERATACRVKRFEEDAQKDYHKKDFRRAVYCMNQCLSEAPNAITYKLFKAECLAYLSNYSEACEIANSVLVYENMNADALYVRGLCMYYEDNIDKAQQHFKQVLKLNPDHEKSRETYKKSRSLVQKKEEGNIAFKAGDYLKAYETYTSALQVDPFNKLTNAKLYNNRAAVAIKMCRLPDALDDCTKAIELNEKYVKAYARRAKIYADLDQHEEAVRDYEKVFELDPTRENKRMVQDAKLDLKKSKRKDYYKILGVEKNVSEDQLKKAYRKLAMLHHPDRHSNDTPEKQKEEEKIFKDVGEAYAVLSDPKKKARYDSGADMDGDGFSGFGNMDANNIFQMFFGGNPGGDFSFGDSHGYPGYSSGGGRQFHFQF